MSIASNVVWSEGMLITPQHFQQNDKHNQSYIAAFINNRTSGQSYGLSRFEWDESAIELGKIRCLNLSGVFPDGTCFDEADEVIRDIPENISNVTVYLALPLLSQGKISVGEQQHNYRYRSFNQPLFDMTAPSLETADTELFSTNLQLKFDNEDLSAYSVLPIARILQSNSNEIVIDQGFIPCALQLQASQYIQQQLQSTLLQLKQLNQQIAHRLSARQSHHNEQTLMMDIVHMQTLNRWHTQLQLSLANPNQQTSTVYQQLCSFSAELAALEMEAIDEVTPLNPEHMFIAFNRIFNRLKRQLAIVKKSSLITLSWDTQLFEKRRILRLKLTEHHKIEQQRFVIGIKSNLPQEQISELVPKTCRLAGHKQLVEVLRNGLSGVPLSYMSVAPNGLNHRNDMAFFEIDTQHPLWLSLFEQRETLALHVDSRMNDIELYLHILGR